MHCEFKGMCVYMLDQQHTQKKKMKRKNKTKYVNINMRCIYIRNCEARFAY